MTIIYSADHHQNEFTHVLALAQCTKCPILSFFCNTTTDIHSYSNKNPLVLPHPLHELYSPHKLFSKCTLGSHHWQWHLMPGEWQSPGELHSNNQPATGERPLLCALEDTVPWWPSQHTCHDTSISIAQYPFPGGHCTLLTHRERDNAHRERHDRRILLTWQWPLLCHVYHLTLATLSWRNTLRQRQNCNMTATSSRWCSLPYL